MKNNSVYRDALKFSCIVFLLGIVEFIIFSVCLSFRSDILIGVAFGCAFVSFNFFYLAYSVTKSLEKEGDGAKMYMAALILTRCISVNICTFWMQTATR